MNQVLVFLLGDQRYGLPLSAVERVVRVVEITPLPRAPEIVLGIVNIQGSIVPVVNARRRFRLPERDISLSDQLIVARTMRRSVALVVDFVSGVVEHAERQRVSARDVVAGMEYVEGVVKLEDGLILIHDLERFLSLDEEAALDQAFASR